MCVVRWTLIVLGLVGLSTVVLVATGYAAPNATVPRMREFTITASRFAYEPATIVVNKGDTVRLRLESTDVEHGIYVDEYGVSAYAAPGQPGYAQFVADRPGTFRFRCAVSCGVLHPFMIGQIEVQPNSPLTGAIGLTILVGGGTVVYVWQKTEMYNGDTC